MTPLTENRLTSCRRRRWNATFSAVLAITAAVLLRSTAQIESAPRPPEADLVQAPALAAESAALSPHLNVVPTSDGELWIHAQGTGPLAGEVYANTEIGPGHHKGGWTMTYSDTLRGYVNVETVVGLTAAQDDFGSVSITTTHGLDSGPVHFERYYVPLSEPRALLWPDGALELEIQSGDTFTTDTYLAVAPSWGLPHPVPPGHRLASPVYSVRASGALQEANRPLLLRLYADEDRLNGADPHTLAVFGWDSGKEQWSNLGGTLFAERGYLSVATRRLTSYTLMSTPAWRDEFDGLGGLSERSGVVRGGPAVDAALVLDGAATSGYAVSVPISMPVSAQAGALRWESLTYSATVDAPTQTLTVDLLRPDGALVWSDVPSGADLSDLEGMQYPALKLRAHFSSTAAGESPLLYRWQLAWNAETHTAYLPLVTFMQPSEKP